MTINSKKLGLGSILTASMLFSSWFSATAAHLPPPMAEWVISCPVESQGIDQYLPQRSAWGFVHKFKSSLSAAAIRITLQNCHINQQGVHELRELEKFINNAERQQRVYYVLENTTYAANLNWMNLSVEDRAFISLPAPRVEEPMGKQGQLPRKAPNRHSTPY